MFRRYFILILFFTSLSLVYSSQTCTFDSLDDVCERFSSPYNKFILDYGLTQDVDSYVAFLSPKGSLNVLALKQEGNVIENVQPFVHSGVYTLKVDYYAKSGQRINSSSFDFVFDNQKSLPPNVRPFLWTQTSSISINGSTQYGGERVRVFDHTRESLITQTTSSFNDKSFGLDLEVEEGVNLVYFDVVGDNDLNSEFLGRIIYRSFRDPYHFVSLASVSSYTENLNFFNERTIFQDGTYLTSKRNFYIEGLAEGGDYIFVQGVKTPVINGKFATFVNLNGGMNEIVIEGANNRISLNVNYIDTKFDFYSVKVPKIVASGETVTLSGKTTLDVPFYVYLNGGMIKRVIPYSGNFELEISANDVLEKNYLYFIGPRGSTYSETFYRDENAPEITFLGPNFLSDNSEYLFFQVHDDLGIEESSLKVSLGSFEYGIDSLERYGGEIYSVPVKNNLDSNLLISVNDRVGKPASLSARVETGNLTFIENLDLDKGEVFGNKLYVPIGQNEFVLNPSKNVAFKSVYQNGIEITDYIINRDDSVYFKTSFEDSGDLVFTFINQEYQEFTQTYSYIVTKKLDFSLDYVENIYGNENNPVKLKGKVLGDYFDPSNFEVGGSDDVIFFGNYFEANIPLGDSISNVDISGKNLVGSSFKESFIINLKVPYGSLSIFESENIYFKNSFDVIFDEPFSEFMLSSYDGLSHYGFMVSSKVNEFPTPQRYGLRVFNPRGISFANSDLKENKVLSVDDLSPQVYLVDDSGENKLLIDGTYSEVMSDYLVQIMEDSDFSECLQDKFYYGVCLNLPSSFDQLSFEFSDEADNQVSGTLSLDTIVSLNSFQENLDSDVEIFYVGNDREYLGGSFYLQGHIRTPKVPSRVSLLGRTCEFDGTNFVCFVEGLPFGVNELSVEVDFGDGLNINEIGGDNGQGDYIITNINPNSISLDLFEVRGEGVIKFGNTLRYFGEEINTIGNISQDALIYLIVDGNEMNYGVFEPGEVLISSVSLDNYVNSIDEKEIDVRLKATQQVGSETNVVYSNKISMLYSRLKGVILSIFIE